MSAPDKLESKSISERKARILDGARRCFVRLGFHAATMQDVATEAEMSPGNLYRYFASKEALVSGMVGANREMVRSQMAVLCQADDFPGALELFLMALIDGHEGMDVSLSLEICGELKRNPVLAKVWRDCDRETFEMVLQSVGRLQENGAVSRDVQPESVLNIVLTLVHGLCVRRVTEETFDVKEEVHRVMTVIRAILNGTIAF